MMMIFLKNQEEISLIKEGADILGRAFGVIAQAIKPDITTKALDKLAEEFIGDHGGAPSFKGFENFPASICTSVNDGVVHGIPDQYKLQEGDIISVDCGVYYKGFHSDSAFTFPVGEITTEAHALLRTTKEALYLGIDQAIAGNRLGDIGETIQDHVYRQGYTVVKELVGHGIGKQLHEQPQVPNYGKRGSGVKLKPGMVIAIEPMINLGGAKIRHEKDGWTIRTLDRKLSAHFEHTVVIRESKAEILTTYQYIEAALKQ
jgi:methionyl aminopeptidase